MSDREARQRKVIEGVQAVMRTIAPGCTVLGMLGMNDRSVDTLEIKCSFTDKKPPDFDLMGQAVAGLFEGVTYIATHPTVTGFRAGDYRVTLRVLMRVPPQPTKTIYPPPRPDPSRVAPATMRLLRALADGSSLLVLSRYRVQYPILDGQPVSPVDWETFMDDLTTQAEGRFFDGYMWLRFGVTLHSYIDLEHVENTEEYLLDRIVLNDAGRAFVAKEPAHE